MKKEICHVCKKEKKSYLLVMDNNIISFLEYEHAREKGPICERCNKYYAMTGEFKDADEREFAMAEKAAWFARMVLRWWEKDEKIDPELDSDFRYWPGTSSLASWCRNILSKE